MKTCLGYRYKLSSKQSFLFPSEFHTSGFPIQFLRRLDVCPGVASWHKISDRIPYSALQCLSEDFGCITIIQDPSLIQSVEKRLPLIKLLKNLTKLFCLKKKKKKMKKDTLSLIKTNSRNHKHFHFLRTMKMDIQQKCPTYHRFLCAELHSGACCAA